VTVVTARSKTTLTSECFRLHPAKVTARSRPTVNASINSVKRFHILLTSIGVVLFSFGLLVFKIGQPPTYVIDEKVYVESARNLLHVGADATLDSHPPLAKFLIAGGMKLVGDNPAGWRLASTLFGSFTVLGVFLWTYVLLGDYALAVTASLLTIFNNFLYVMSRLAMLDVFYFAFVVWALLAFTAAITLPLGLPKRCLLMLASGVLFGLGCSCKWTAVVSMAVAGAVAGFLFLRNRHNVRQIGLPILVLSFVILPSAVYCLSYWPQFIAIHKPFAIRDFFAMNAYVWRSHVAAPGNPAIGCPWYRWFFRTTPLRVMDYLMGNYVVMWGGVGALLICAVKFLRAPALAEGLIISLYAANVFQWVIIPEKMTQYYYYYPPATLLSLAIVLACASMPGAKIAGVRPVLIAVAAAGVFFLICYPKMAGLQAPFDCALTCWPY